MRRPVTVPFRPVWVSIVVLASAAAVTALYLVARRASVVPVDPIAYEQTVTSFYRGLAALDTGLLDNAQSAFVRATELAAQEPAAWADLGLARLRGGDFDASADAVARAV